MLCPTRLRFLNLVLVLGMMAGLSVSQTNGQVLDKKKKLTLEMSKAVACKRIDAYEKYTPLPDAALTSEDKLQVYYRPLGYRVEAVEKPKPGFRYRARFSQDFRIRRKGEKTVISKKDKVLEYDPTFDDLTSKIYMLNSIGLKGIPPGEYELDIILRDVLNEGSSATQSLSFTIIPLPKVEEPKTEGPGEPEEGSTGPKSEAKNPLDGCSG